MQRRFSLFRRKDRGGLYCAQLWSDDLGKYLTGRRTGADTRNAAVLVVSGWIRDGWPTGRQPKPRPEREAVTKRRHRD